MARQKLEIFVKTANQIRLKKPVKKALPAEMQKLKSLEERTRKKKIISGLKLIENINKKRNKSDFEFVNRLRANIEKNGFTEENVKNINTIVNNMIKFPDNYISHRQLDKEFGNKTKSGKLVSTIPSIDTSVSKTIKGYIVDLEPFGIKSKILINKGVNLDLNSASKVAREHEKQHIRDMEAGFRYGILKETGILHEFLPMLKQIEKFGNLHAKKAVIVLNIQENRRSMSFESKYKRIIPENIAKNAIVANELGIRVRDFEKIWKESQKKFKKSKYFMSSIFDKLSKLEPEQVEKMNSEQKKELKKRILESVSKG